MIRLREGRNTNKSRRYSNRALVTVVAKTKNEEADASEKEEQEETEHRTLPECLGDINGHNDRNDKIDDRNEVKKQPPSRPAGNLQHDVSIVEGNQDGPAWLTGLLKHLPPADDDDHRHCQPEQQRHAPEEGAKHIAPIVLQPYSQSGRHDSPP